MIKVNVHGSAQENPRGTGCGGFIRDDHDTWLGGFTSFVEVENNRFSTFLISK